jgi:RNA polymerase sigma-70 factor (ECF subfamily)
MTSEDVAKFYDAHAAAVFGFLMTLTGSEAETKDLLQEVFVRLSRWTTPAGGIEEPRAFLLTLGRRTFVDSVRRRETRNRFHTKAAEAAPRLFEDASPDAGLCREAVEESLAALPQEQREAVVLHVWTGLTFREIAAALDIPLHTAASRCRYGLTKLRSALQPLYDEIR